MQPLGCRDSVRTLGELLGVEGKPSLDLPAKTSVKRTEGYWIGG